MLKGSARVEEKVGHDIISRFCLSTLRRGPPHVSSWHRSKESMHQHPKTRCFAMGSSVLFVPHKLLANR